MNMNNSTNNTNNDEDVDENVDVDEGEIEVGDVDKIIDIINRESKLETEDDKRIYLIGLYDMCNPIKYNKETLDSIGSIVRNKLVRNIKFIDNEHTSGLSKEGIAKARSYPSFWKPDLTRNRSLQNDIFKEFPNLSEATLFEKVEAWMGMRYKVIHAIRSHRNATQTSIQISVVEGKLLSFEMFVLILSKILIMI